MWLVVGLGNPGPTYCHTRHNVGFMVVDRLAHRAGASRWRDRFGARACPARLADTPVLLLKPQIYMNRSGVAVRLAADWRSFPAERILVIHDDVDLPFGILRLKEGGGHGGHKGLRSLVDELGSNDFLRVRVGIGRPEEGEVTDHVLGSFDADQTSTLPATLDRAADAVEAILEQGLAVAANRFNRRPKPPRTEEDAPGAPSAENLWPETEDQ